MPDKQLRYNEVTFLTSHNSYASRQYGYRHAQQSWTIAEQLAHGVRGLMLDTYHDRKVNKVIVCHGKFITPIIKRTAAMALHDCLEEVKQFIHKNRTEIITIFLENYVAQLAMLDEALMASGLADCILKPTDWDIQKHKGWPTLAWMQNNNKRIVIFNCNGASNYMFDEWKHVIENQYGTLRIKAAARERSESRAQAKQERYLYLLNYIPSFKMDFGSSFTLVNSTYLKQFFDYVYKNGLGKNHDYKNKFPNFINVDHVDQGSAIELVNHINQLRKNSQ